MPKIIVAIVRTIAYSGTTWANMVLASHPEAFYLGAGDYSYEIPPDNAHNACQLHGAQCPFWPDFIANWDRSGNFITQLADYSSKRVFITNNPSSRAVDQYIRHPDVEVKYILQLRDGRAITQSAMRHHPERYSEFYDAVRAWFYPAWKALPDSIPPEHRASAPIIRYEDMIADWRKTLDEIGAYLGLEYSDNAVRYWEFDQHPTTGNQGTIYQLKKISGTLFNNDQSKAYYDDLAKHALTQPDVPILDRRWLDELSITDRIAYDFIVGHLHKKYGYQRESFSLDEILDFMRRYDVPLDRHEAVAQIPRFNPKDFPAR